MSEFDPVAAAESIRNLIVGEAPNLYAENRRLQAALVEHDKFIDKMSRRNDSLLRRERAAIKRAERVEADNARLQAAHDHQHAIAGTLLREAERVGRENAALRAAIVKCRAHTSYLSNADRALLAGLLDSITRICDAALGDAHE